MQKNKNQRRGKNQNKVLAKNIVFALWAIAVLISLLYVFPISRKTKEASADSGDNISGWAWSENIGWVSFNSTNTGSPIPYGVDLNTVTGNFDSASLAWSSNVGWLSFKPISGLSLTPPIIDSYNYDVRVETDGKLTGWAKFTALPSDQGWMRFNDPHSPSVWGVIKDACSGGKEALSGFAWSDDFGWVKFSGPSYGVYLISSPSVPNLHSFVPPVSPECNQNFVEWDDVDGETGYYIERSSNGGASWDMACGGSLASNIVSCIDSSGLLPGIDYQYHIQSLGCNNSNYSSPELVATKSVCDFPPGGGGECGAEVCAIGQCANKVDLSWGVPPAAPGANLEYTAWRKTVKDSEGNSVSESFIEASGVCKNISSTSCTDTVGVVSDGLKTYVYKIVAKNLIGGAESESAESAEVKPCIALPSWIETNPR